MLMKRLLFVLVLHLSAAAAHAQLPGPLVSTQWLDAHRDKVVVLDVRSDVDAFTQAPEIKTDPTSGARVIVELGGHIPGARLVDFDKTRVTHVVEGKKIGKMLPSAQEVTALMRAVGLNRTDAVVITSQGESYDEVDMAARLYWTLKSYGHGELALLDGGNAAWLAAGLPVSTEPSKIVAGNWAASELRHDWLAERDDIASAPRGALVDARPAPQYLGLSYKKPAVTAPGHIADAVSFPPDVRLYPAGSAQKFLSPAAYHKLLGHLGVKPQKGAIVYCNTGHMASGAWFVLSEILGVEGTRLYDGSMHEWTTLGRPVVASVTP